MMTTFKRPQNEIDQAMEMHLSTLRDAFFDLLVALLTVLLGMTSILHAVIRIAYAVIGLSVWTLGVWIILLQSLRAICIAQSSSSPFCKEVQDE